MNLKKFISGVSALAIAASAFAGMAVTANAGYTCSNTGVESYTCTTEDTQIASSSSLITGTIGNMFYSLNGSADYVYYRSGSHLVRIGGHNADQYVTYKAPCRGAITIKVKQTTNSDPCCVKAENLTTNETYATKDMKNVGAFTLVSETIEKDEVIKVYMPEYAADETTPNKGGIFITSITFSPSRGAVINHFSAEDTTLSYNAVKATISKTDLDGVRHQETKTAALGTTLTGAGEYYVWIDEVPNSVALSDVTLTYID